MDERIPNAVRESAVRITAITMLLLQTTSRVVSSEFSKSSIGRTFPNTISEVADNDNLEHVGGVFHLTYPCVNSAKTPCTKEISTMGIVARGGSRRNQDGTYHNGRVQLVINNAISCYTR